MPLAERLGTMSSRKNSACRRLCSAARVQIAPSTSRGSIPDAARTAIPAAIRRLRPATRTMKNSSRLLAKNAIDRTRSSRGRLTSSASSSRRRLKRSQERSRSRKRSSYFARCASASASGTYGGATSKVSCTALSSGTGSSAGLGTALDTVMSASVAPRRARCVASASQWNATVAQLPRPLRADPVEHGALEPGVPWEQSPIGRPDVAAPEHEEHCVVVAGLGLAVELPALLEPDQVAVVVERLGEVGVQQPGVTVQLGGRVVGEVPREQGLGPRERLVD